jgi:hypothetical protein
MVTFRWAVRPYCDLFEFLVAADVAAWPVEEPAQWRYG